MEDSSKGSSRGRGIWEMANRQVRAGEEQRVARIRAVSRSHRADQSDNWLATGRCFWLPMVSILTQAGMISKDTRTKHNGQPRVGRQGRGGAVIPSAAKA